jgi:hypothetical protein
MKRPALPQVGPALKVPSSSNCPTVTKQKVTLGQLLSSIGQRAS